MQKAHVLNGADDLGRERRCGRDTAADAVHGRGHDTAADREDRGHQLHSPANGYLCQNKANEMPQCKLRPLQFPEGRRRGKDADCKEQYEQAVADPDQSGVDVEDHAPDLPAFEGLRGLRDQRPQLSQFIIPSGNGIFEVSYDPVITYGLHLTFTKSFQRKIVRFYC